MTTLVELRSQERYVNKAELAELMGVGVRTIERFMAEGMPFETWGMQARRFLPSIAMEWARERARKR